ncbi:MAG: hypothetical protein GF320_09965, partial [Armatimonadia bacterium]|nr:hypothetical protein [Armatimonadia bacterium]
MADRAGERIERARANRQPDLHVIVEDPRKDSNVSAVVRSAEALGVAKLHVIKSDGLGQSLSPKVT